MILKEILFTLKTRLAVLYTNKNRMEQNIYRQTILSSLLNFSKNIDEIRIELQSLPWDYDGSPVIFSRSHILNILLRFLRKEVNEIEVENWANLIEGREDIDFENGYSDELSQMIYQLSNPELERKLDIDTCKEMIDILHEQMI